MEHKKRETWEENNRLHARVNDAKYQTRRAIAESEAREKVASATYRTERPKPQANRWVQNDALRNLDEFLDSLD